MSAIAGCLRAGLTSLQAAVLQLRKATGVAATMRAVDTQPHVAGHRRSICTSRPSCNLRQELAQRGLIDLQSVHRLPRRSALVDWRTRCAHTGITNGTSAGDARLEAAAAAAVAAARPKTDLRKVPGVGPKNESLLLLRQIDSQDALQAAFLQIGGDAQRMREWLHDEVGIRNSRHCKEIAAYLEASSGVTAANGRSAAAEPGSGITLAVEGNISAGKSTFLRILAEGDIRLRELVEVVPEPVDRWQAVGKGRVNVLDMFYHDPQRMAYTFQNYVFISRVVQEHESRNSLKPLRLLERSVFSDRMVFVRAIHDAKWLSDAELEIYDSWFDPMLQYVPGLVPHGFIYLRAEPETCHRRMQRRDRTEESGVSLDYLADLHSKHEEWLRSGVTPGEVNSSAFLQSVNGGGGLTGPMGVASVAAGGQQQRMLNNRFAAAGDGYGSLYDVPSIIVPEPESIRGNVLFLKGQEVHPALHNVPALVLDCDQDIDLEKDLDAKAHFAHQVAEYAGYVKTYMARNAEAQSSSLVDLGTHPSGSGGSNPLFMLPRGVQLPLGASNGLGGHQVEELIRREGSGGLLQRAA